jgi:hypothetical protein
MHTLAAVAGALALAALPQRGVLVPGSGLGGLKLGMTPTQVRTAWGSSYGRCRNCADPTWYFTYTKFQPAGAGVEFHRGRLIAIFTLWAPTGWRTSRGLLIGDAEARVTALYGPLLTIHCTSYDALVSSHARTQTAIYVRQGTVWGFGLSSAAVPACR